MVRVAFLPAAPGGRVQRLFPLHHPLFLLHRRLLLELELDLELALAPVERAPLPKRLRT